MRVSIARKTQKFWCLQNWSPAVCTHQLEDNLEREKKVRGDVEKAKRKLEQDLKATQQNVEELERVKRELEENVRR